MNWFPHRCGRNYWDVWDWPQTLLNQNFGLDLNEPDDWLDWPSIYNSGRSVQKGGASQVISDEKKFAVKLDCSHFKPEEIEVKTIDNNIVIHGKHEERKDKNGYIRREFSRRYALPERCEPNQVTSSLQPNGLLTIEAPKKPLEPIKNDERRVPINVIKDSNKKQIKN